MVLNSVGNLTCLGTEITKIRAHPNGTHPVRAPAPGKSERSTNLYQRWRNTTSGQCGVGDWKELWSAGKEVSRKKHILSVQEESDNIVLQRGIAATAAPIDCHAFLLTLHPQVELNKDLDRTQAAITALSSGGTDRGLPSLQRLPDHPVAEQWQVFMAEAAAQLVAASSSSHGHTLSDIVSLGGSEPDINRLPQVAEALNVIIKKPSNTPSSGQPAAFSMEWLPPKQDDSSNMQKVLAILQKHVCDDKSVAVNATSRDIFNKASFPAHFSAKRVKLNPTKTDCLIVAKSVEEVAVENPTSIYQLFGLVEVKKPEAYKSKLDRWCAQASGQFLGWVWGRLHEQPCLWPRHCCSAGLLD
ncbi:hypothetical protein ABBQ32_004715 [Trebouxia sp. C0010 RCD-2024]